MRAPTKASDINKEWIQYILTDYESSENPNTIVSVDTFEMCEGSIGEGLVGIMIKLQVKATLSNHSQSVTSEIKQYDLAIKLKGSRPTNDDFELDKLQVYLKEILIYSKILVELDNFQKSKTNNQYPINTPKLIYSKYTHDEFVLVMENIQEKGFSIHKKFLNFEQLKLAVTELVNLHAVSYSYNNSNSFLMKQSEFKQTQHLADLFKSRSSSVIDAQIAVLKNEKDKAELLHKIEANKTNLLKQYQVMHNEANYKLLCLVHGDTHTGNMMFKYSDCGDNCDNPSEVKLYDWQLTHWNTPVLDLHFLIYPATSTAFRKEYLDDILRFYHSTFTEATSNMGVETTNWSYDDFRKEFDHMAHYGINSGLLISFFHLGPGSLRSSEEEKQIAVNYFSMLTNIITAPMVKIYQYFFASTPDTDSRMKNALKAIIMPNINEVTFRNNKDMASQILGLIHEGEEIGLYN
ncbi:unnamed protein product [Meganyctiphanes norvegica]|uniref:CHK kinase-like domain-containing protein n=1 Tax=Meganyctiphanes norvegica TaxID=48144 RepID=A0AAV2PKH1_MEGNR